MLELEGGQLETLVLEALDDFANEATRDTVGLDLVLIPEETVSGFLRKIFLEASRPQDANAAAE